MGQAVMFETLKVQQELRELNNDEINMSSRETKPINKRNRTI